MCWTVWVTDSFVLAIFVRNVFRSDKYYRRYVRNAVGNACWSLCQIFVINQRYHVSTTNRSSTHKYYFQLFLFRIAVHDIPFKASSWYLGSYGWTDTAKLIGPFKVFVTKTTKEGRNKETNGHNLNPEFTVIRYLSPQPGNRSSSFLSSCRSYGNIGPPQESPAYTVPCHLLDSWLWGRYSRDFPSDWDRTGAVVNKRLGGMEDGKFLW